MAIIKLQLKDLYVHEISGVTRPANRRKFLIVKNEKPEPAAEYVTMSDAEVFVDYVTAAAEALNMSLDRLFHEKPDLYEKYKTLLDTRIRY